MKRSIVGGLVVATMMLGSFGARADGPTEIIPNGGQVHAIPGERCASESAYDADNDTRYGAACRRMHIVFGPIFAKPGQNDLLIQPVVTEKPTYDGYLIRFKPNLVGALGTPPVEDIHLHHGTWLNAPGSRSYGSGPWLASGEEKTIATFPDRYGLKIQATDQWLFLHMVHNATPKPQPVWVIYDIDYVDAATAETVQPDGRPLITNTRSIWLDVGNGGWSANADPYFLNPVYNVQRGFGSLDAETGTLTCTWPKQNCARFNSSNRVSDNQGNPVIAAGKDHTITTSNLGGKSEGTLVLMGGHLHTGGIRDEVSLVRDGQERLIHISDAYYWNHAEPEKVGALPDSWDMSMTGVSVDIGWKVHVKAGDKLRLNAVYDSELASWYENMGIVMTWLVPGAPLEGAIDPFAPGVTLHRGIPDTLGDAVPEVADGWELPGAKHGVCSPSATTLCVRGQVTHPHYISASNHASPCPPGGCPALPAATAPGPEVTDIQMGGFTYGIADLNAVLNTGTIPRVKVNSPVTFWNADTADYMWHTLTACARPCTGATTASYPIADGWKNAPDSPEMDFDSGELGVGAAPRQAVSWTLTPDTTGIFTFYCRIHPSMRGAINVVA